MPRVSMNHPWLPGGPPPTCMMCTHARCLCKQAFSRWPAVWMADTHLLLQCAGSDRPVYNGIEMMSRMELVRAVREMQTYMQEVATRCGATSAAALPASALRPHLTNWGPKFSQSARRSGGCVPRCWRAARRYERMGAEQSETKATYAELATEIAEAREHWVAENQYNAMLQVRGVRMAAMSCIRAPVSRGCQQCPWLPRTQEELEHFQSILEAIAADAVASEMPQAAAGSQQSLPASPSVSAAIALERAHAVAALQVAHVSEAEVAAERLHLPSPTAIRQRLQAERSDDEDVVML